MIAIKTAASLVSDFVTALCVTFVLMFFVLAYFEPTTLDGLAHNAHEIVPTVVNGFIAFIMNLF